MLVGTHQRTAEADHLVIEISNTRSFYWSEAQVYNEKAI